MKRHSSGAQKRKEKKAKERESEIMTGSILKFVQKPSKSSDQDSVSIPNVSTEKLSFIQPELTAPEEDKNEKTSDSIQGESVNTIIESLELNYTENLNLGETLPREEDVDCNLSDEFNILRFYSDVGNWPVPLSDGLRIDIIKRGSESFQNKEGPFESIQRSGVKLKGQTRQLATTWFYKHLPSGEKVLRKWMVYSPSKKSLFCFCCRLFTKDEKEIGTSKFVTGFQSWWKLNPKVTQHECSEQHLSNLENWKTLAVGLMRNKTIDAAHQEVEDDERKKWKNVLHRLLDITLFLAKQNLPFRGHREHQLSENRGNFLELVELLSNYDPVLKEHVIRVKQSASSGKSPISYLSPQIQNEFIIILGNIVKEKIIADIKKAKYYGILFDSTPDVSHFDQMSEVIRYVHIECGKIEVRESFLGFFTLTGKKANEVTEEILKALEDDGMDITLCRSQGYDNESTMAGVHSGVQARIRQINKKALFVPCANHSLNLCGVHAFGSVPTCVTFFGTLESVFTFFSASTHRWAILMQIMGVAVKKLSETRWSAQHDAVKPIMQHFDKLVQAVERLCDPTENVDTRGSAEVLMTNVCDYTFLCYLHLWSHILEEVNHAQKYLQIEGISLEKVVHKLRSLKTFLVEDRDKMVENALKFAEKTCKEMEISIEKRGRKRFQKVMPGEKARDEGLSLQQELRRCMFQCIDRFYQELKTRTTSMEIIDEKFAVVQPTHLIGAKVEELPGLISNLTDTFDELQKEEILPEIKRLRRHIQATGVKIKESTKWKSMKILEFIVKMDFQESVPNLCIALRLYLTVCVSIASCERSFSKLKLIKSYLRSTMSQTRLNGLAMLSIENAVVKKINFDESITKFAEAKARKKLF